MLQVPAISMRATRMPWLVAFLAYTLFTIPLWHGTFGVYAQSNTTCASSQLDWYSDVVGETPCMTYQRLRQICNSDYQVQRFRPDTPGDNCDDQVSRCCCNSVSWALSMMCMNCQYDTDVVTGRDAGVGAYQMYLGKCNPRAADKTLPDDIQAAVCNKEIKIDRNLYGLTWGDGAWFYMYTKQTMTVDFAATNNNTFTHCNSTIRTETSSSASAIASSTATAPESSSTGDGTLPEPEPEKKPDVGPIVGGAVGGGLGAIALGVLAFFLWTRYRRRRGPAPIDLAKEYTYSDADPPTGAVTPFSPGSMSMSSRYDRDGEYYASATSPEQIALLPRGPPAHEHPYAHPFGAASKSQTMAMWSPEKEEEEEEEGITGERHQDGGPAPPTLQRSESGRLPPAYRRSWDNDNPEDVVSVGGGVTVGSGGSSSGALEGLSLGGGGQGAGEQRGTRPQYMWDVKMRPGET